MSVPKIISKLLVDTVKMNENVEGLRIFHKGLGFFEKGLRFSSSVSYCFSYGYAIFGEGEFFSEVEIFPGGV